MESIAELRKNYTRGELSEHDVPQEPFSLFQTWFEQAVQAQCPEPNAMGLATANEAGIPSVRIVLLKAADHGSFTFFTNYESQKGKELATQPHASLLFHWHELERQVRISGTVERVSAEESDTYFHSRPAASRIGAWASPQSAAISSRTFLEEQERQFKAKHGDNPPRPPHWGGYRLRPDNWQFWQGRKSRLHDRLRYTLQDGSGWLRERLAP
jgi:pyridoxamine 5'-phosphate oxidase